MSGAKHGPMMGIFAAFFDDGGGQLANFLFRFGHVGERARRRRVPAGPLVSKSQEPQQLEGVVYQAERSLPLSPRGELASEPAAATLPRAAAVFYACLVA
jgi:hypothetical protein